MNIEENTESIQKEILQHKIKVMGKDWVQNRLEAKEQVQDMKKHLNSLSEEEAHRQAVEQAEKIKRLREFIKYCKDNGLRKGKTVLGRCSKQFCFLKCDALVVQITKWETPTKTEQKKLKKIIDNYSFL